MRMNLLTLNHGNIARLYDHRGYDHIWQRGYGFELAPMVVMFRIYHVRMIGMCVVSDVKESYRVLEHQG